MESNCFFSVIVPVFKVEPYLQKCIESVLRQSFSDFELILVDDGSPDSCPQICDAYAKEDNRIRVIHKENGGLSSARNSGLRIASGKYVSFLDSDDFWLNDSVLESVHKLIVNEKADIVILKAVSYFQSTNSFSNPYTSFSSSELIPGDYETSLGKLISASAYRANAWNKVFSRELMERQDLFFTEGVIAEDMDWAARLCLAAKSITIFDAPVYAYRTGRPGAITASLTIKNLVDTKDNIFRCLSYVEGKKLSERFRSAYYSYVAYRFVIWMAESSLVKDKRKEPLIREMREYTWLLKYDGISRVGKADFLLHLFGFRGASIILGLYLKKRKERRKKHGNPDNIHAGV